MGAECLSRESSVPFGYVKSPISAMNRAFAYEVKGYWFESNMGHQYRGVAQLAARGIWDAQAGGSNPLTPTNKNNLHSGLSPLNTGSA